MTQGILLTGATGLLGRYLLRDLLSAGERVVVLVRGRKGESSAYQRVDEALRPFEQHAQRTLPRPIVVEGSLHEPNLGLSPSDRQLISAQCTSVLHCAASVKFQRDPETDEPFQSNVTGTQRLVELCAESGLQEFHYISTAYICGGRKDRINEDDFDQGQQFRNVYEQTKFRAEQILRESSRFRSLTIYRPSIIVGDYETGFSSTFHGFYLPLHLVHAATSAGYLHPSQRGYMEALGLTGSERKNVVPVNWVSAAIVSILRREACHGKTYHLTNPHPVTTDEIEASIREAIGESIANDSVTRQTIPLTSLQTAEFRKQMGVYAAYLSDDPDFDARHTNAAVPDHECPRMDHAALVRMARFAIQINFGWPRKRPKAAELDVGALLARLPKNHVELPHQLSLTLEVSGSGGGLWRLAFHQGGLALTPLNGVAEVSAYMNVYTLQHLLLGVLSVERAVAAGRVVLEGTNEVISRVSGLLEALFTRLREAE